MRIEINYHSGQGVRLIDLNADELKQIRRASELIVQQNHPAGKSLRIEGDQNELELLALALLDRADELRRRSR